MPKLTKRAIRYGWTYGRTDPNYRNDIFFFVPKHLHTNYCRQLILRLHDLCLRSPKTLHGNWLHFLRFTQETLVMDFKFSLDNGVLDFSF